MPQEPESPDPLEGNPLGISHAGKSDVLIQLNQTVAGRLRAKLVEYRQRLAQQREGTPAYADTVAKIAVLDELLTTGSVTMEAAVKRIMDDARERLDAAEIPFFVTNAFGIIAAYNAGVAGQVTGGTGLPEDEG